MNDNNYSNYKFLEDVTFRIENKVFTFLNIDKYWLNNKTKEEIIEYFSEEFKSYDVGLYDNINMFDEVFICIKCSRNNYTFIRKV